MDPNVVSAWIDVAVPVGTVVALLLALSLLRVEQRERSRSEVRSVRCWIEFREPTWVLERRARQPDFSYRRWVERQNAGRDGSSPELTEERQVVGVVENASGELLQDVRLRLALPEVLGPTDARAATARLQPAEVFAFTAAVAPVPVTVGLESAGGTELLFTDGRGRRWFRGPRGQLSVRRPLRWWAPWRVPERLELDDRDGLPWWAVRAHWAYRWDTADRRRAEGWPPPWWALDVRWRRAVEARRSGLTSRPGPDGWRRRRELTSYRLHRWLPPPWWALDERWRYWRWFRRERRVARSGASGRGTPQGPVS